MAKKNDRIFCNKETEEEATERLRKVVSKLFFKKTKRNLYYSDRTIRFYMDEKIVIEFDISSLNYEFDYSMQNKSSDTMRAFLRENGFSAFTISRAYRRSTQVYLGPLSQSDYDDWLKEQQAIKAAKAAERKKKTATKNRVKVAA